VGLQDRPFIGTYQINRTLVRHTPDCIVHINGVRDFVVCSSCNRRLDVNKYITSISVDPSVEPVSTANLSLSIPRSEKDAFIHGGQWVLDRGLEVVIFMRGYFPMKNFGGLGQDPADIPENYDANAVPLYPYYQVFRGVVTSASHSYSGGFYSLTLSCANLLHFWQNLKLSVNGSVFGKRPSQSMVEPSLIGHKFTGANPYAIIYTLVKVGFGAAYGVDFLFSQSSNIRATSDAGDKSLYKHAAEWWEQRWTEHSGNLRMYGIDGTIFNAFEQAYLGRWYDTRERSATETAFYSTAKQVYTALRDANDFNPSRSSDLLRKARQLGYDPYATTAAIYDTSNGNGTKFATEDILRMQAFTLDLGKLGAINLFETEYMSKLEIAEAVKSLTGYEFYQDVDGDLVFKPPMYNLDTRSDPVYVIKGRDLIDFSETVNEPEATMVKGTGSHFQNLSGHGIEGWLGVGAVYIDYRLVAQYGYREETFETSYMSSRQAIFVSAMNRLDLANEGVRSASIQIPLRPELRPGYPVYIETQDCFYYAKSISHSFQFNGQCTTTINGVARRAKWLPPMEAGGSGLPSIEQVRLDAPGEYPQRPLYAFPQYLSETEGSSGPPRAVGFPNVVMALDADKINFSTLDSSGAVPSVEAYLQVALSSGFLERGEEADTFLLRVSNESQESITLAQVQQEWDQVSDALREGDLTPVLDTTLGRILEAIQRRNGGVDVSDLQDLVNRLVLQTSLKSVFSPGTSIAGQYRYFSSSHPSAEHQAPANLSINQETQAVQTAAPPAPDEGFAEPIRILRDVGEGKGIGVRLDVPARGIQVAALSQKTGTNDPVVETQTVRTSDIRFVTFGPQFTRKRFRVSYIDNGRSQYWNFDLNEKETRAAFDTLLRSRSDSDASKSITDRFSEEYNRLVASIDSFAANCGVAGLSKVTSKRNRASSVSVALDSSSPLTDGSAANTVSATFSDKSDPAAVETLSEYLASALWSYTRQVIKSTQRLLGRGGDYTTLMEFRAQFIQDYTDGAARVPDADPSKTYFFSDEYNETASWSPIFPVSDAAGYEVFGSLPYGRGVDIEKYAELIQSKTTGTATDSGTEAAVDSTTLVGTSGGSNAASLAAIEQFFAGYLITEDAQEVFNSDLLSDAQRQAILATFNTTEENLQDAVEQLTHQDASQNAKIRNTPVTSFFRGQSVSGDVAAINLARIGLENDFCFCRGSEAAFLFQALQEEYIDQFPEDPVQGYLDELATQQASSWQAAREAFAGPTGTTSPPDRGSDT
jgi:hypothetical protein